MRWMPCREVEHLRCARARKAILATLKFRTLVRASRRKSASACSLTSKPHGTGLGLAIVQSVISDHGGRISVRSKSGRGATFVIELPRNVDKLQAADQARIAAS